MRVWLVGVTYALAFLCGLLTVWAVAALGVTDVFESGADVLQMTLLLPLLAGLCVFSLVYGLASGRMLKWRFWLFAPLSVGVLAMAAIWMMMSGWVTLFEGLLITVVSLFASGFLFALKRDATSGVPSDSI